MVQTETVAGVLRSDRLGVAGDPRSEAVQRPGVREPFPTRFPGFRPEDPGVDAQAWLLDRFQDHLHVGTLPRTLLIEIRFRSRDPQLSADVVNALIAAYQRQQADQRVQATGQAVRQLQDQLHALKTRADEDDRRLAAFQKKHGILIAPETLSNGGSASSGHLSAVVGVDELGKELAACAIGNDAA